MESYGMKKLLDFSKEGVNEIIDYMHKNCSRYKIIDIQDDIDTRKTDVDLIIVDAKDMDFLRTFKVEVKTDRYFNTGNYFFETISNKNKGTLGCFLYTKADYIYYYFIDVKELHIIPVKVTRKWFLKNIDRFPKKWTSTRGAEDILYSSEGRIVPRAIVMNELSNIIVKRFN